MYTLIVCFCFILQAVECNQFSCLTLLLEARADIAVKDKSGNTCLHYAARCGSHDVMDFLVKAVPPELLDLANNVSLHSGKGTVGMQGGRGFPLVNGPQSTHISAETAWPILCTPAAIMIHCGIDSARRMGERYQSLFHVYKGEIWRLSLWPFQSCGTVPPLPFSSRPYSLPNQFPLSSFPFPPRSGPLKSS